MPKAAPRVCTWPGCASLVPKGRCAKHAAQADRERGTSRERGYTSAWQKARDAYLRLYPICAEHMRQGGRPVAASVVDHKKPHRGDMVLFWDSTNWQRLCKPCHDRKTASADGGFGR